jgi:hypothetical protein
MPDKSSFMVVPPEKYMTPTTRIILSETAKIFHPLGWHSSHKSKDSTAEDLEGGTRMGRRSYGLHSRVGKLLSRPTTTDRFQDPSHRCTEGDTI